MYWSQLNPDNEITFYSALFLFKFLSSISIEPGESLIMRDYLVVLT